MLQHLVSILSAGLLVIMATGCGGEDSAGPIMTEAEHRHYHVHAVDASHEHAHGEDGALGGHEHSHQHSK
jgi:hypothetical protein